MHAQEEEAAASDSAARVVKQRRCGEPFCDRKVKKKCAACQAVRYCSSEHQKMHWKEHKKTCVDLRACAGPSCDINACKKKCAACQAVWYCSSEHQKKHWKEHKKTCVERKAQSSAE